MIVQIRVHFDYVTCGSRAMDKAPSTGFVVWTLAQLLVKTMPLPLPKHHVLF